jgi:O-antigen ligase
VVLFAACSRIYLGALASKRKKFEGPLLLLSFGLYGAFNAGVFSYYPIVSLTKIILFTYATCAILVGFQISAQRHLNWTPWFLGMWLSVVTLSIPTLMVSDIGYARDGQGFQGILSHPQTFAVFLAPMVCWMLGQYLFVRERLSFPWLTLLAVVTGLMFMTLARTAVVTVIVSLVLVFAFSARYRRLITGILRGSQGYALIFIILAALPWVAPDKLISDFVMKGSDAPGIGEAYELSRGFLVARAWENFVSHPFVGIGFGVSFEEYFSPVYDKLTGLPIRSATEKSLLPVVLLEELGIVGLILFIPILYKIIRIGVSSKGLAVPLLILGCLMVNIGESVLFSIAALGLYLWLLIGWALSTAKLEQSPSTTT